jgi:hypothetical protein
MQAHNSCKNTRQLGSVQFTWLQGQRSHCRHSCPLHCPVSVTSYSPGSQQLQSALTSALQHILSGQALTAGLQAQLTAAAAAARGAAAAGGAGECCSLLWMLLHVVHPCRAAGAWECDCSCCAEGAEGTVAATCMLAVLCAFAVVPCPVCVHTGMWISSSTPPAPFHVLLLFLLLLLLCVRLAATTAAETVTPLHVFPAPCCLTMCRRHHWHLPPHAACAAGPQPAPGQSTQLPDRVTCCQAERGCTAAGNTGTAARTQHYTGELMCHEKVRVPRFANSLTADLIWSCPCCMRVCCPSEAARWFASRHFSA